VVPVHDGHVISDQAFAELAAPRLEALAAAARHMREKGDDGGVTKLTRPLLGRILSECAILEEFLDSFGARRNLRHYALREVIAVAKLFAAAGYKLLHVSHSLPRYQLRPVRGDFAADTHRALDCLSAVLSRLMRRILKEAQELGTETHLCNTDEEFEEFAAKGVLPNDRQSGTEQAPESAVVALCTEILQLATVAVAMEN
jgi:hypothetical protein